MSKTHFSFILKKGIKWVLDVQLAKCLNWENGNLLLKYRFLLCHFLKTKYLNFWREKFLFGMYMLRAFSLNFTKASSCKNMS